RDRHLSSLAHGSARRHETRQGGQERRVRPAQCVWRGLDFPALGQGRFWYRQQSHEELFCRAFFPVAANGGLHRGTGLSEPRAISRCLAFTTACPPGRPFRPITSFCIRSALAFSCTRCYSPCFTPSGTTASCGG